MLRNLLLFVLIQTVLGQSTVFLRWCVSTDAEKAKCENFQNILKSTTIKNADINKVIPGFSCVVGFDTFECMKMIQDGNADMMALDTGQGYFAGRYHNMQPIVAEKYAATAGDDGMNYYSVAVVRRNSIYGSGAGTGTQLGNGLLGSNACFPGIGTAAGWLYPISVMLQNGDIKVTECNAVVKAVTDFFHNMCLPGALTSFYNPFGNNPTEICQLCKGTSGTKCSTKDPSAGYDGAFRCLQNGDGDVAFLRHDTLIHLTNNASSEFVLLCPNGGTRDIQDYKNCNYGSIPANTIMTSALQDVKTRAAYKQFLLQASEWFGVGKPYVSLFNMFSSDAWLGYGGQRNLLFTDTTQELVDVGDRDTYYKWVDAKFYDNVEKLNQCPLNYAKWCVISGGEKSKCENMMMAFGAKDLKPKLDCVLGKSADHCMQLIADGDADMMTLDSGDVYLAGEKYGLKPIAAEDYGNMEASFYVVAAAWKRNPTMTLFNLKDKRACMAGMGRGDGWIVPVSIFIETEQFVPQYCSIFENIGQLFIRTCIPGALDSEYNPNQYPISLCEGCAAGGYKKCQRNQIEQYYGATGAFRCLVENGGDVAFVRHLTVRDNTDARNHAIWARNRRSDDYELMCKDGTRKPIDEWRTCHLGKLPSNAVVTGKHKSEEDVNIYWQLLNYGQQFFSSDTEGDFHMFDSGTWYNDLMFTDDTVRLIRVPDSRNTFSSYLGRDFIVQAERLQKFTCVAVGSAPKTSLIPVYLITVISIIRIFV
ncbi:melanotransferrin-like [Mytilus edulis]|uniref:Melanoma-associated antigen p97 n=1 Tax=Mytilus galloprovincialis TaxID=29158 RepID=A0A8B6EKZ8_MYTGA|nr:melanoma-associated antigen p97 [Mytilus galloprovincialis]VDI36667.1 melanoma-associated antigen p97 [Mytilus galloprovincialis]VDI36668.1 melanoma-associated antigen p97 [Mytilus galloprovincialis]